MKKLLLFAAACIFSVSVFSQSFQHGVAVGPFFSHIDHVKTETIFGVTYSPRINFVETADLSVSAGVPLTLGVGSGYSSRSGNEISNTTAFMFNLPVIINLNIGAGSSRLNKSRIGAFAGGGYAYHYSLSSDKIFYQDESGNEMITDASDGSLGPVANAGLRLGVGKSGKSIELRFSYFKGVSRTKLDLYGIQAGFNF